MPRACRRSVLNALEDQVCLRPWTTFIASLQSQREMRRNAMLCNFSRQFPKAIGRFLDRSAHLRRRFREETVTDLFMGSLVGVGGGNIIVDFPDELTTGADMQWDFVNTSDNTHFRIMVQAKRAYGRGKRWSRHNYAELLRDAGNSGVRQAKVLCDDARNASVSTFPLYAFYHSERLCNLANASPGRPILGVNIASGYAIEKLVSAATTRTLRTQNKSLGKIRPLMHSLSTLFCPVTTIPLGPLAFGQADFEVPVTLSFATGRPALGFSVPPRPAEIRSRLAEMLPRPPSDAVGAASDAIEIPPLTEFIPDDVRSLMNGTARSGDQKNRWRAVLISRNPPDYDALDG